MNKLSNKLKDKLKDKKNTDKREISKKPREYKSVSLDDREQLEYPKIYDFFKKPENFFKIYEIINKNNKRGTNISLSILDWFVTNYSKKYNVIFISNKKPFNVNLEYKIQLTSYKKEYFDPFNRGGKLFVFEYDKDNFCMTTFKQLNFLKWALRTKVIKYVEEHSEEIRNDYKNFKINKQAALTKKSSIKKKPEEIPEPKKISRGTSVNNKQVYLHKKKFVVNVKKK